MSGSNGGSNLIPPGATVLTSSQANQLIEKLRNSASGSAIKIQTISTSAAGAAIGATIGAGGAPVKQIVFTQGAAAAGGTTVVSTAAGAHGATGSPLKVIKVPAGSNNVKVVKIAPPTLSTVSATSSASATGNTVIRTINTVGNAHFKPQIVTTAQQNISHVAQMHQASPNIVLVNRKRTDIDFDSFNQSEAKRRKNEKGGKGLRHFSMKVCEKVQAKGITSYNEVADELVGELTDPRCTSPTDQQYDQKNIRRRVYDALNVLMAMNIISKEKKEIKWLGLPTNSVQEANGLEIDKANRIERIKAKTHQLQDLILQQIAFKNLVERNKERERSTGLPAPNSAIQLPFIVVNTSKKTVIDCSISNDKMEYLFNFDDTFEIHDDMEVLKRMGLSFGLEKGNIKPGDLLKARSMVPRALEQYVTQLAEAGPGSEPVGMPQVSAPILLQNNAHRVMMPGGQPIGVIQESDHETDSDVEIN